MSWITIVWSMNAAACLTLAGIFFAAWCKQRESRVHLIFSCIAAAAAAIAVFELELMHADTPGEYGALLRWRLVPVWVLVVSLVGFTRLYLHAGRSWLAWSACGLKTLILILNFIFTPNLHYRKITALRQLSWGGEMASVPVGIPNPWSLLNQAVLLLLLVFFVDATITVWRRGERQRALLVGGSIIFFGMIVAAQVALVVWGVIQVPFFGCFAYLGIAAALGYQLCDDTVRAAQLLRKLEASQAALRKTKQDMEIAANAVDLAVWTWDIARDEVWLSHKVRSLFGFSPSEKVDTKRIRSVIHPEDRDVLRKAVKNSLQTGAENPVEYRVVLPNGEIRWLVRRSRTEFDRNGKPVLMHGILFDITERKFAEERFRLVVDVAPTAMIMANKEGRIALINKRAETLFGYKGDELVGQPVEMLVPERFRSHHANFREGYFGDDQARPMGAGRELFGQCKDGSEVPIEIDLNPVHTSEGLCVLASVIDISERKAAELEAARQRHELAHLSRVTMVGELSGSLAHELNQPLTAILSNAQAAQKLVADGAVDVNELRQILSEIVAEDKHAGDVIQRLRLLLRKDDARHYPGNLDINEIVGDVLKLMRNDLVIHDVTVHTELAQYLPAVAGDRVELQQVLLNLVLNGCEAMAECDSPERQLFITSGLENGAVRVSVTDRGGSIPEEKMQRVFEPFFTTKAQGMGLGLSVCRTIIEAHRGNLWATNNAEGGATFHFSLPTNGQARRIEPNH
jgi:two-component system, LuxR family, sensor kinase FixL